jgi:inorganic pyrophosphatase/exopolyphosphatase
MVVLPCNNDLDNDVVSDTDTMVSSLAFAHHLAHRKKNPEKAVALLQIERDVIGLRRENSLVLKQSRMGTVHRDLLSACELCSSSGHLLILEPALDQLPFKREKISQMIKGIYLVDQNLPLS